MGTIDWLTNWDDLVHGTAVFSAAIPFVVVLLATWKVSPDFWWAGVLCAVTGPFLWLFGLPAIPPSSSEDVLLFSVVLTLAVLVVSVRLKPVVTFALGLILFGWLVWSVYPAWLEEAGGLSRKWLVCGGCVLTMAVLAICAETAGARCLDEGTVGKCHLTLSGFFPPMVALAVLLQLGGAGRLGQAAGAIATALGTVCCILIVKNRAASPRLIPALWGVFFALLAWCGWLFADIRYGLAAALCLAPLAGLLTHFLPLPRRSVRSHQLWEALASAVVSGVIATIAISDYLAESSEFDGY